MLQEENGAFFERGEERHDFDGVGRGHSGRGFGALFVWRLRPSTRDGARFPAHVELGQIASALSIGSPRLTRTGLELNRLKTGA